MSFSRNISYILHPIIFPLLGSIFYLALLPRYLSDRQQFFILSIVFVSTFVIPVLLLSFLKRTQMITSFHLNNLEERKYPLLLFSFLAILVGRLLFKASSIDDLALYFIAGGVGMVSLYLFLLKNIKVSIHTLGVGSLIGFFIQLSLNYQINLLLIIGLLFLIFGILAKARLKLRAHTKKEVLWGVFIGIIVQLIIPILYRYFIP